MRRQRQRACVHPAVPPEADKSASAPERLETSHVTPKPLEPSPLTDQKTAATERSLPTHADSKRSTDEANVDAEVLKEYELQTKTLKQNNRILITNIIINGTLAISTVMLALYTNDLAVSTKILRDTSLEQLSVMQTDTKQTEQAIIAANHQASAAETANEIARENGKRQIRSYVLAKNIITHNIGTTDMYSVVVAKNSGQTPAYQLTGFGEALIIPFSNIQNYLNNHPSLKCGHHKQNLYYILGPGEEDGNRALPQDENGNDIKNFSKTDLDDLRNGRSTYMIRETYCYKDIFGEQHMTTLCSYYLSTQSLLDNSQHSCSVENDSD